MTDPAETDPPVDVFAAATQAAFARYWRRAAVAQAESVVIDARAEQLLAEQDAADRRVSAAQQRLSHARLLGDADRVATTMTDLRAVENDYTTVTARVRAELNDHLRGQFATRDILRDLLDATDDALSAELDARRDTTR